MGKTAVVPLVLEFAKKVRSAFRVEKLIFFGSRVGGDYLLQSDYDFILVSSDFEGIPFIKRPVLVYPHFPGNLSLEVLCYTPSEFQKKANGLNIVSEAVKTGVEV